MKVSMVWQQGNMVHRATVLFAYNLFTAWAQVHPCVTFHHFFCGYSARIIPSSSFFPCCIRDLYILFHVHDSLRLPGLSCSLVCVLASRHVYSFQRPTCGLPAFMHWCMSHRSGEPPLGSAILSHDVAIPVPKAKMLFVYRKTPTESTTSNAITP